MEAKEQVPDRTDLRNARVQLEKTGASVVLCRGTILAERYQRGVLPLLELIECDEDFSGCSAADKIVGRAAALLFVRLGVRAVYGEVMSRGALAVLSAHGIAAEYGVLTEGIQNRAGTGSCPMELAVQGIDEPEEAYRALRRKTDELRAKQEEKK